MEILTGGWHVATGTIMNAIKGEQLLTQLNWRYATQQFDPSRKIPPEHWAAMEEALILSPSSYGLQPWTFVVITDQKMRERLFPSTWNQRQILDCSHFVVFTARTKITQEDIDRHVARTAELRGGTVEALRRFREAMAGDLVTGGRAAQARQWATQQAYIALGNFMTSAALLGIDTCPMEGFKPEEYDEILDLTAKRLASVVCCAAGYRSADDKNAGQKKVRFARTDVIHIV